MLSQDEFELLINDPDKFIKQDISWNDDTNHWPSCKFKVDIESDIDYQIMINGQYNPYKQKLTYLILHKPSSKVIYRLDLGQNHRNPDGKMVGEVHKHRWQFPYEDKFAYFPQDITAKVNDPVQVWSQFCKEANIIHSGKLNSPPPFQPDIFI